MNSKPVTRTLAVAMTLALAAGSVATVMTDASAAAKPTMALTTKVNLGKVKKLSITKNGFTIKKVTTSAKNKNIVDVDCTKSAVFVTGMRVGNTVVTTKVKAMKKKTTRTYKLKTKVYVQDSTASQTTPTPEPAGTPAPTAVPSSEPSVSPSASPSSEVVVGTQGELDIALRSGATKITIGSTASYLTIQSGTYKNTELTINAPYANVVNYATFKSIKVSTINSMTEYGSKNSITVSSNKAAVINVMTSSSVSSLTLTPSGNLTNHRVDARSGTIDNLNLSAGTKATVSLSNSAVISRMTEENNGQVDLKTDNSSQVQTFIMKEGAQATVNGNSTRKAVVDLKEATNAARLSVYATVIDKVLTKETTISKPENVVINRTTLAISNQITRAGGTTYYANIAPLVEPTKKESITIGVTNANLGNTYIEFYSNTYLKLDDSKFEFMVRKGSSSGTIINTNHRAASTDSTNYYRLTLNQALEAGTYYVTMSTSLNYQLAPVSFTIKSSGINFTMNNLVAGKTFGTTKVTGIDTQGLQYLVNNEAAVTSPNTKTWNDFPAKNANNEIAVQQDQYIHLRVKGATTVSTVQVTDAGWICGEAERVAAVSAIGGVISAANRDGDFMMDNLNTKRRWVEIKNLVDEAQGRIAVYEKKGGKAANLTNYSTYQSLYTQFTDTSKKLIVDVAYPDTDRSIPLGANVTSFNRAFAVINNSLLVVKQFSGATGAGEPVNIVIAGWGTVEGDDRFDQEGGNWFRATSFEVPGRDDYCVALDQYEKVQFFGVYKDSLESNV